MTFEFATAGRILFGPGRISEVGNLAAELGDRVLLVIGGSVERAAALEAILHEANLETCLLSVEHEPTVELVQRGRQVAVEGLPVFVGGPGAAVQEKDLDGWIVAHPLGPDVVCSCRGLDRDEAHAAGEHVDEVAFVVLG